ncbi:MAG: phosphoglucomutase (alpha-D-glucose-1,6-bisphosphate-dependent) [Parachlamydiaceae bacterium]
MEKLSPLAGKPAPQSILVNIPKLVTAYYAQTPDVSVLSQRVKFGTSGHRGSSFDCSFNESHILAITQAICDYRKEHNIEGPLFLGIDPHALSFPAYATALEVLAANEVNVMLAQGDEYTPTPVISHAILNYNRGRKNRFADGIVITPSHNPPDEGGFKYNTSNGGPADPAATDWIEAKANQYIRNGLKEIRQTSYAKALRASTTHRHDYLDNYIKDLVNVIDMQIIRDSKIKIAVDPLGGAGVHYWRRIADFYSLNLTILNESVDPTFSFMSVDWDGRIRMDPSSPYAMHNLIKLKDHYRVAFACDTDHDRHGIVAQSVGLLSPNHFLSVAIFYLFEHRPRWKKEASIGKTLVSSQMIDFVSAKLGRKVYEVPVGFKWFVDGLMEGSLAFVGEESAGATFARFDGSVWSTDKDGMIASLLSAEMTAQMNKDPGEIYQEITQEFGQSYFERFEAIANQEERNVIKSLCPDQVELKDLAGEKIQAIFNRAPGNHQPIGGIKVVAESGWFAARPSGTENIYRIYVESFKGEKEKQRILEQAQSVVNQALKKAGLKKDE